MSLGAKSENNMTESFEDIFLEFSRTGKPFTLDEVLFIMNMIGDQFSTDSIGRLLERDPNQIVFTFCSKAQSVNYSAIVKQTEAELLGYHPSINNVSKTKLTR